MLTIDRGKQQILFNYLPGRTFDFGKKSVIAIVSKVRGSTFHELNNILILRKIREQAQAWNENYRPALRNDVLMDESRFVIVDPKHVSSTIFPLVFWCTGKSCKKVFDFTRLENIPNSKTCPHCNKAKLIQLRFIKVHRCGHIEPLTPPNCPNCHSNKIALDDRGSERISNFRWRCLDCGNKQSIFPGQCNKCSWPNSDPNSKRMEIEVFRSNRTFYVHSATLINIPQSDYDTFFRNVSWHLISAAKYLDLPQLNSIRINDFARGFNLAGQSNSISSDDLGNLFERLNKGEINQEQFIEETAKLKNRKTPTITDLQNDITSKSGLSESYWDEAKYNILESIVPFELGDYKDLETETASFAKAKSLGIERLSLISDFPIIISSFGFSRTDYTPNDCFLQPFPIDRENGGKFPVYVDKVNADALIFKLDPLKVISWLRKNGFDATLPNGSNVEMAAKAYFIQLFHNINVHEKLFKDNPEARMVMSLVHTFSHLTIKHAALLCGLDKTSIAEYIIPKTLTFAIYCNHRFGATIGALTSLFEQSVYEWLSQVEGERKCVYDPVCYGKGATCHSCTHLAETSCRFFNLNLGRIYLFGGHDPELNLDVKGYFDFTP